MPERGRTACTLEPTRRGRCTAPYAGNYMYADPVSSTGALARAILRGSAHARLHSCSDVTAYAARVDVACTNSYLRYITDGEIFISRFLSN